MDYGLLILRMDAQHSDLCASRLTAATDFPRTALATRRAFTVTLAMRSDQINGIPLHDYSGYYKVFLLLLTNVTQQANK